MAVENSLVYVDKNLVVPLAAKLLGSTISISKGSSAEGGFDWFFQSRAGIEYNKEIQTNIVDFFAEDIFAMAYDKIENRQLHVKEFCKNVQLMKYSLSDIVSIEGILQVPNVSIGKYNPFDPPKIDIPKTFKINDINCYSGRLSKDGFTVPIYFPINSKELVCYCIDQPVEIVGVLKWSPPYDVNTYSMNQIVLAVALLQQR
ncbi:MAG: hypothetical protein HFF38_13010 [Lawsonibacter sp.]|nr:hypothetical protein [Lawsonibacter sp.]